jgi:hypothetical protein
MNCIYCGLSEMSSDLQVMLPCLLRGHCADRREVDVGRKARGFKLAGLIVWKSFGHRFSLLCGTSSDIMVRR